MYPVYGLAEASLAVSFPPPGSRAAHGIALNRHRMNVGDAGQRRWTEADRDAIVAACPWAGQSRTAACASPMMTTSELPPGRTSAHAQISGDNVTQAVTSRIRKRTPQASLPTAGCAPGISGMRPRGRPLHHRPRQGKSSSSTARTTTRTTSRAIAQRAPSLELGKVVAAGVRPQRRASTERSASCSSCIAVDMTEFLPHGDAGRAPGQRAHRARSRRTSCRSSASRRPPAARSNATCSEESYLNGGLRRRSSRNSASCARLRQRGAKPVTSNEIEAQLKDICDAALPSKRRRRARQPVRDRRRAP